VHNCFDKDRCRVCREMRPETGKGPMIVDTDGHIPAQETGSDPRPDKAMGRREAMDARRRPALAVPPGACDCHIHVFGPPQRFPLATDLAYTPAEAQVQAYIAVRRRLGLGRTVVIQPSAYGADNACTLEAIAQLLPNARGIAVVDPTIPDAGLERLHNAGIRGLRFSLVVKNAMRPQHLEVMAKRIQPFGWHIQFRSTYRDLPELESHLQRLPVDVCLDHLGGIPPEAPLADPAWRALLRLLARGRCWVKLSAPYQLSRMPGPGYADYAPQVRALVKAAPQRLLWGTNWPHPLVETKPDDADLLDSLGEWIAEESLRRAVLVENPAVLYGFPPIGGEGAAAGMKPGRLLA
jgi:predicted TIM-barrel fold metal-dependent hydrolase